MNPADGLIAFPISATRHSTVLLTWTRPGRISEAGFPCHAANSGTAPRRRMEMGPYDESISSEVKSPLASYQGYRTVGPPPKRHPHQGTYR
jgi:hypothetical protein